MTDVVHFGLAFQNQSNTGEGVNSTVRTIERCSYGMMTDVRSDYALERAFRNQCQDKFKCKMLLDFSVVFDERCEYELRRRTLGQTFYGPPKVFL
mmetsp:Transcript_14014/g.23809  ORF Transcript_14014/g.23809 Transcript_14014/m.23809 type:complete len:95 (-) Transcript_14014:2926-3210(-)